MITLKKDFINAMAVGIIPFHRIIILGNVLMENCTFEEQEAILYHEYAHHKNKDLSTFFLFSLITSLAYYLLLYVLEVYILKDFFLHHRGLGLATFAGLYYFTVNYFVYAKLSHDAEFRADCFSSKVNGKEDIINALKKLNEVTNGLLEHGSMTHLKLADRVANINNNV